MPERYDPSSFEAKWRKRWLEADLFRTREEPGRPKFYYLDFFPYPSGAGLSVGHCRNYVPGDVMARFKFMQGFNVLHPMGFDAFGLPAENEAIKRQRHPSEMIDQYGANYKRQMDLVAISYDWSRSFKSSDPTYYKWTQWIFKKLYEKGLAYRSNAEVNWCPKDKTALANEEVVGGLCERCGTPVEKRAIPQWFFKITDYAQRLIDDLDTVDWPEGIKALQRNWIGRSEGAEFTMKISFSSGSGSVQDELQSLREEVMAEGVTMPSADAERIQRIEGKLASSIAAIDSYLVPSASNLEVKSKPLSFKVFTTRLDTIFGMTFCVLAPEHPVVDEICRQAPAEFAQPVRDYQVLAKNRTDMERMAETKDKTGVFTGAYAINPFNGKRVPIWIADYVLATYGTGAIMAVPGHDQRDFDFAVKYGLEVIPVIKPSAEYLGEYPLEHYLANPKAFNPPFESKESVMINSGSFDGLSYQEGTRQLAERLEAESIGERKIQYKLRDWLISRQRYWGCPIPVIHSKDGEMQLVPDDCLPVYLPNVESYEPSDDGSSPLSKIGEFVNVTDLDGRMGRRETDTMGGFACSSWYFLRFCDPHNEDEPWNMERVKYWMPVDCYVGGAEHAVMHLLYARFWTKVLYDLGLVPVKEPFQRLMNQGQVLGHTPYRHPREGETLNPGEEGILLSHDEAAQLPDDQKFYRWVRMSKSKGNVVTPEEAVEGYGADALRVFELFIAPFEGDVQWSNEGMNGTVRFLSRIFKLVSEFKESFDPDWRNHIGLMDVTETSKGIRRATHRGIQKAGDDIERFSFNTYISSTMIWVNELYDFAKSRPSWGQSEQFAISEAIESLILVIAPAAPHSADELWEFLGKPGYTYYESWPKFDPALCVADTVTIAVQVNGKLRDTLEVAVNISDEDLERIAQECEKVKAHTDGKTVRKVIVIPGKLVNIVAN